jgi:3-(3-hydroxy-phenyl)propionate hydroxylase
MLGHDHFEFEWISVYRFHCRRMQNFVHDRVIFAGDAAHQVSPFGARGANSGIEDAENLGWKLAMVLHGEAPPSLLDSYGVERGAAADENIRESTRSTDFMAPSSAQESRMRRALLSLANETEFAKRMINGGRLSVPSIYDSPLSTMDSEAWGGGPAPGASMRDAPLNRANGETVFLSEAFTQAGRGFTLLQCANGSAPELPNGVTLIEVGAGRPLRDDAGFFAKRYDAAPGTAYLLRPDGYIAARFRQSTRAGIKDALARASGYAA